MRNINVICRLTLIVITAMLTLAAEAQENADTVMVDDQMLGAQIQQLTPDEKAAMAKAADKIVKVAKQKRDWTTWRPDAKRAMWLAIVLPGAGQIYNRKYWKLPIVYGGFLGCAYAMRWNNQMYNDYSQAYLDIMDNDPNTQSYNKFLHLGRQITPDNEERYKGLFKQRKDRYRRWRDLSFFCMLGVYGLSIIDAYVDASLSSFDISDDLSLTVSPAVVSGKTTTDTPSAIGVQGALKF